MLLKDRAYHDILNHYKLDHCFYVIYHLYDVDVILHKFY